MQAGDTIWAALQKIGKRAKIWKPAFFSDKWKLGFELLPKSHIWVTHCWGEGVHVLPHSLILATVQTLTHLLWPLPEKREGAVTTWVLLLLLLSLTSILPYLELSVFISRFPRRFKESLASWAGQSWSYWLLRRFSTLSRNQTTSWSLKRHHPASLLFHITIEEAAKS